MRPFSMLNGSVRRNRTSHFLLLGAALVIGTATNGVAQIDDHANPVVIARGLTPTAAVRQLNPLETVQTHTTAALDLEVIEQQDIKREMSGLAPRFAIPRDVVISPLFSGTWELIDKDTWVWRMRLQCPGAHNIYLGFTTYSMPVGGQLFVYSTDGKQVVRGFSHADNEAHGQLWTPVVLTDDLTVEVTIPADRREALELELTTIGHGYRGFGTDPPAEKSGACNIDVVCPVGDPWENEIQSVAVIGLGSGTFCTGFMVNNTAQDRTPYFMTADHCGITAGNAASLVAYWNYETSVCDGTPDGVLSDFNTGSTFRAGSAASDFTLVELDDDPDPAFEVTFAGWDRSAADPPAAIAIHHPNTDEKRISFEDDPTATTTYFGTTPPGDGSHLWVVDWDLGTTEPGSSGSPLFNPDHRVVGQLHGGLAACGNDDSDWYGRFSVSWTGGGSSSTRLSDWLDPISSGAMTVDTIGLGLAISPSADVVHFGVAGGPFTPNAVVYTLSNTTGASLNYSVSFLNGIGLLLNGGTSPVAGTLANGANVNVTVSTGATINGLAAGTYFETVIFDDTTNGLLQAVSHIVEVDQTLIAVTPATDLFDSGPEGGPYTHTVDYLITSERPSPVTVQVSASDPWISLNGGSGPLNLPLSGTGDSTLVTVGFSASAYSLAPGLHTGTVTIDNLTDPGPGPGDGSTTRNVSLDVGRFVFLSGDTPIAIPDSPGGPITSSIVVTEAFCIGDVDVSIDITHTFKGDLTVELESPSGVSILLHNRSGGSGADIITTYDDDGGTLPDGPGALADFEVTEVAGTWILRVQDNAGADTGTLNSWQLGLAQGTPGPCPIPEVIADFPLDTDPGWSPTGQWAFGAPLGIDGDPFSGFTGPNVYGYNLSGDYANSLGSTMYLTTDPIDLTGYTGTRVSFQRWLGIESSTFDFANFQISTDGAIWTSLWEHDGGTINETSWNLISYDISAIADEQPSVMLRWGLGPTDGSVTYHGWNIDDVMITGFPTTDPCPADTNGDNTVNVTDLLALLASWGTPAADFNDDGDTNVTDLLILLGAWGACP